MKSYNMEFNLELLKSRGVITVENYVTGDDLDKLNREFEMFCSEENSSYLEAIAREDWASACRATLDYYDRCYDHE